MRIPEQKKTAMFYDMLRIRLVQERIESLYMKDEMKTPIHLCIGQEAVAVGVCSALVKDDYISSNHRGHGHYLAKGGDLNGLIAELHCRETGCAKGRGGSMHLVDTRVGHLGSSSIVGGGIPLGTGLGLALQMKRQPGISVVFFGDGAADEGVLYESINFAILKRLPVVYALENNAYSVCSPVRERQAGRNIFHYAPADQLLTALVDGNDVEAVYGVTVKAVERARDGLGPSFIECSTYRILGHAGCSGQDARGYRPEEEVDRWKQKDPIKNYETYLLETKVLTSQTVDTFKNTIGNEIDAAFDFARKSPLPSADRLFQFLYKE